MEAVAAVGVAAAALQFLDFSTKTLALCKQIRDSPTGSTEANAELTKSVKQLTEMQKELRQAGSTPSRTLRQLVRAVQECSRVSTELLQLLEDIREVSRKSFGPMRSAFRAMKDRKTVEKLQKRLADCQEKFQVALTIDIRQSVAELLEKQGKSSDTLQNVMLPELKQLRVDSSDSHAVTHDQLQSLAEDLTISSNTLQRSMHTMELNQQAASTTIVRGQSKVASDINTGFSQASKSAAYHDFYASLFFDDMFARQQSIRPRQTDTYEWIFTGQSPYDKGRKTEWFIAQDEKLRGSIMRWFHSDQPCFRVNGKAGSGKTSLMSFIEGDKRTQEALGIWARNRKLSTFSFFFWRPGSSLQKSIPGLLRTILYQLTKAKPAVINRIVSVCPSLHYSDWTEARLLVALKLALTAFRNECVFLLVDGLDEFEGDYSRLLDALASLQVGSNVKTCVSSRPETAFVRNFADFPAVSLHRLNHYDIEIYARSQLKTNWKPSTNLVSAVTDRAEGVFLWAVLVCKSLVSGMDAGDDDYTLHMRLNAIPSDLADLFKQMFAHIDDVHRADLSLYFLLLSWSTTAPNTPTRSSTSVALVTLLLSKHLYGSIQEYLDDCEMIHGRILAQSKGLIEIRHWASPSCSWSFRDMATGYFRHRFLDVNDVLGARDYVNSDLGWVHRSAFDYVLGVTGEDITFRTVPLDEINVLRNVVQAHGWLAQYAPMIHVRGLPSYETDALSLFSTVSNVVELAGRLEVHDLVEEAYKALDEIYGALYSSVFECCTPASCVSAVNAHYGEPRPINDLEREDHVGLLHCFWSAAHRLEGYFTTRFDVIKRGPHGGAVCAEVLYLQLCEGPAQERGVRQSTLLAVEFVGETCTGRRVLTGTLFDIYADDMTSWKGSKADFDMLFWICGYSSDTSPNQIIQSLLDKQNPGSEPDRLRVDVRLVEVADSYQLFRDCKLKYREPASQWQNLRLLISQNHYRVDPEWVLPPYFHFPCAVLRLACFRYPLIASPGKRNLPVKATYFDLSTQLTTRVIASCYDLGPQLPGEHATFTGTLQECETCYESIVDEIWEDANGQLDAWGQLYLLANVKKWFRSFWEIDELRSGHEPS